MSLTYEDDDDEKTQNLSYFIQNYSLTLIALTIIWKKWKNILGKLFFKLSDLIVNKANAVLKTI